jgi:hypothetical protein
MRARAILLALLLVACGKEKDEGPAAEGKPTAAAATTAADSKDREAVLAAWKKAGLEPSAMTAAQVGFGSDCKSGTVSGVDVLVCVYPSPDQAKAAQEAGYGWVGQATGISQARGAVLIAAADRRKADPSGRTINQLAKTAPK